ncbi:hypothetical protein DWZ34_14405, partial [Phocaeicola plebeius]
LLPDSFFPSFSPCYPLFPYRSPGRLSEIRQETFSPKRRVILHRKLRIRSERAKIPLEEGLLWNVVFRVEFSEENIKKAGVFTPACENIN